MTAVVADPLAELPYVNVLVLPISATVNPPGPVYEKLVKSAILNTTVDAVVCVRFMLPAVVDPNAIERVAVLFELNIPVDRVTPSAIVKLPAANVYVLAAFNAYVLLNVTVPEFCVNAPVALNVQLKGLPP